MKQSKLGFLPKYNGAFLGHLGNVNTRNKTNGAYLRYDSTKQEWFSEPAPIDVELVRAATESTLPNEPTFDGNVLRSSVSAPLEIDSVSVNTGDRVLVKDENNTASNGIYEVTDDGASGPWQLTRAADFNEEVAPITEGTSVFVESNGLGSNSGTTWALEQSVPTFTADSVEVLFKKTAATDGDINGIIDTRVYDTRSILLNTNTNVSAGNKAGQRDPAEEENGWYFKNEFDGEKVTWFFIGNENPMNDRTLGTLEGCYATVKFISNADVFFNVFTEPLNDGSDAGSWYRSSVEYSDASLLSAVAGTEKLVYFGQDPGIFLDLDRVQLPITPGNSVGPQASNERIIACALCTRGSAPLNSNEFISNNVGYKNDGAHRAFILQSVLSDGDLVDEELVDQVNQITTSALSEYDIYVRVDYRGTVSTGSTLQPFKTIQLAVDAASSGDHILIEGTYLISQAVTIPGDKTVFLHGVEGTVIKYDSYSQVNGNILTMAGTDFTKTLFVEKIIFENAGGYGIDASNLLKFEVDDCEFKNCGWSGNRLDFKESGTDTWANGGTLGYDSTQSDLQAFYASEVSDGGAIRIDKAVTLEITSCVIQGCHRGMKIIDSGFLSTSSGFGYVARNQIVRNIGIGIDMEASTGDAGSGCENFTIYNNAINENGDSGIKVEGGRDNTISLGIFKGNWNSAVELSHVSNTRVRDLDIDNNNRAIFDAEGDESDALASIQIEGDTMKGDATFLAEVLNTQVHNTGLGANTVRCGLLVKSEVGSLGQDAAKLKIDSVGFQGQDYALDIEANLNTLSLTVCDCEFSDNYIRNIRLSDDTGNFREMAFNNFLTSVPSLEVLRDQTDTTVILKDGVDGPVINTYPVNSLQAVSDDGGVTILLRDSQKAQLKKVPYTGITITGSSASTTLNGTVNALNSLFSVQPLGNGGDYAVTYPTINGADITIDGKKGTSTPAITFKSDGVTPHLLQQTSTNPNRDMFWSTETIDAAGEYYTVKIAGGGRFIIGLGSEDNGDRTELSTHAGGTNANDGMIWGQAIYDYGSYTAPWTIYGSSPGLVYGPGWNGSTTTQMRYNGVVQNELNGVGAPGLRDGALFKIGISQDGYITSYYYDSGRSNDWIMMSRRGSPTAAGNYFLVVKLWDGSNVLVDLPVRVATDPVAPILTYRYIESPDGAFYYPLFATEEEANFVDGGGSSHAHVFIDEPTNTTWYMPDTGGVHAGTSAPINTSEITYTEIPTEADNLHGPSLLTLPDRTFQENVTVNIPIQPLDQLPLATVSGLPNGLTFSFGSVIGTTPYVPSDQEYTITVTRTNVYATTTQTFILTIQDNTSLGTLTGFTTYRGNFVQPDRVILDYDAIFQYDTTISPGQEMTYSYTAVPPTIGILSATGESALTDVINDPTIEIGTTAAYNFAEHIMWDLRYVSFGGFIGSTPTKFNLLGWDDNSNITGAEGTLVNVELKLEYGIDGYFRLYEAGQLLKTSSSQFVGVQTLTFAGFDDQQQSDVYIPSNLTIATTGAGSTTPPIGFVDPLEAGTMASTSLLGGEDDSVVQLTTTLKVNHRYVIPQTWLETNVLPHITGDGEIFYFGVPVDSVDWTEVTGDDFHACFRLSGTALNTTHTSVLLANGTGGSVTVGSLVDAYYDYAIEWDGTSLHVIACNIGDINTQPGISNGGLFSRTETYATFAVDHSKQNQDLPLVIAVDSGGQATLTTTGLQQIRIPWDLSDTIMVGESSAGNGVFGFVPSTNFDSGGQHAPPVLSYAGITTLSAGYTYTFIYDPSLESTDFIEFRLASDNTTVYSTGITAFDNTSDNDPKASENYKGVVFAVPTDAPPLTLYFYNSFNTGAYDSGRPIAISGSTYTVPVTGVSHIPGSTALNAGAMEDGSWIEVDDAVDAGMRMIWSETLINQIMTNLDNVGDGVYIGPKDAAFDPATGITTGTFRNGTYARIFKSSASTFAIQLVQQGGLYFYTRFVSNPANYALGFDLTTSGNNCRIIRASQNDTETVAYADIGSSDKIQSFDQGYGLTDVDIVMYFSGTGDLDLTTIDFDTEITEISIPVGTAPVLTNWNKALDFTGSNQYALQVANSDNYNPLRMGGIAATVNAPTYPLTAGSSNSRPWAISIVWRHDGNSSNRVIWQQGEGTQSGDDQIGLRISAIHEVIFYWGRENTGFNELSLGYVAPNSWKGLYIASNGARFSGANANAANLAQAFDVKWVDLSSGVVSSNQSTSIAWISTGTRMDRGLSGLFTIAGRQNNRSFQGQIASVVVTTLKGQGVSLPLNPEISMMVRDPLKWLQDYKVGQTYRRSQDNGTTAGFALNNYNSSFATQVWLMGDGLFDSYALIRNQTMSIDQNYTVMRMMNMNSSQIQTVNINGLT